MSNGGDRVTTTVSKDAAGKDVVTTSTTSGPTEVVTTSTPAGGPEVKTTVKTGSPSDDVDASQLENYVAIWSKAVETQMHFNEMSVKSRQLGLTFVVAALGLAVVLLSKGDDYSWKLHDGLYLHVAVLLILAGAGAILLVRMLDLGVYHRMLRGAVAFGEEFEERNLLPRLAMQKGMTQAISFFSRHHDAGVDSGTRKYIGGVDKTTAEKKIKKFYFCTFGALVAVAALIFFITFQGSHLQTNGHSPQKAPPVAQE